MPSAPASDLFLAMDTSFEEGSAGVCRRADPAVKSFRRWSSAPAGGRGPLSSRRNLHSLLKTAPLGRKGCKSREETGNYKSVPPAGEKGSFPSHSERLVPSLLSVLKEVGCALSQVDFLAVSVGPGRWTGVRAAVNTARAFSFALKIPCYPLNSLRVTAEDFLSTAPGAVAVAFNAFKNSVYYAEFSPKGEALFPPSVLPFPGFMERMKNKSLCVGDIPRFYDLPESLKKSCEFKPARPRAEALARITVREFDPKNFISWEELLPLYLREDVAKVSDRV